jgi:hypothetical protein
MAAIAHEPVSELSLSDVVQKYPEMPRLLILKTDVQRRGVHYTDRALGLVDESVHQLRGPALFGYRDGRLSPLPESLLLRDGTSIITGPTPLDQEPYIVDEIDGKLFLIDGNEVLEEVEYWTKPAYYDKKTSSGIPMSYIVAPVHSD